MDITRYSLRRARARVALALSLALLTTPAFTDAADAQRRRGASRAANPTVYYRNCTEARAAGVAPIYRGQPGYRPALDRDNDGVACEPYRRRR